jgi:protein TonB
VIGPPKRRRKYRVPRGEVDLPEGPYERILRLQRWGGWRPFAAVAVGIGLHAGLLLAARLVPPPPAPAPARREIPIVMAAPPPVPPAPAVPPPPKRAQARRAPATPRPAAAQAAKVVTVAHDPNKPLDFTGFDMVTGDSTAYAGGFTASKGKSKTAVAEPTAKAEGVAKKVVRGPSQAKPPGPSREDWACAWPEEAQESDLRDARVSVKVGVDRDGAPESVQIIASPAASFAEAARQCAMGEQYRAALDDDGHHIAGTTPLFVVHFVR